MRNTLAEILGPWQQPDFESGLIARCRNLWEKPIESFTNQEIVTCLQQGLAIDHLLPMAEERLQRRFEDDSELFDGQLAEAVTAAGKKPNK